MEETIAQVIERFERGCECQDNKCFRNLMPNSVYQHRLNIAKLTKAEHDMYLMGVTRASIANPDSTVRHQERLRLHTQYVYEGRRVCLDAFLYLENCTRYQLKRIRKHVITHGVTPRTQVGNNRKTSGNNAQFDECYSMVAEILKKLLLQRGCISAVDKIVSKQHIVMPLDISRKAVFKVYREHSRTLASSVQPMTFATFRRALKQNFPNICFSTPKSVRLAASSEVSSLPKVYVKKDDSISVSTDSVNIAADHPDESIMTDCTLFNTVYSNVDTAKSWPSKLLSPSVRLNEIAIESQAFKSTDGLNVNTVDLQTSFERDYEAPQITPTKVTLQIVENDINIGKNRTFGNISHAQEFQLGNIELEAMNCNWDTVQTPARQMTIDNTDCCCTIPPFEMVAESFNDLGQCRKVSVEPGFLSDFSVSLPCVYDGALTAVNLPEPDAVIVIGNDNTNSVITTDTRFESNYLF